MHCSTCGSENTGPTSNCPNCTPNLNQVQVLSPDDREDFNGLTIEQNSTGTGSGQTKSSFQKVFIFNSSSAGTMPKMLLSGILLFIVILFLPLVLLLAITLGLNRLTNRSRQ